MIIATDVYYDDEGDSAKAVALAFKSWSDGVEVRSYSVRVNGVAPYEPGAFYKRELPPLLAVFERVDCSIDIVIVDGDSHFLAGPGLGTYLWQQLGERAPVIGVGKRRCRHTSDAVEITRGRSKAPLFVTAVGMENEAAARLIQGMHGPFRIPTLLKRTDQLTRQP